MMESFTTKSIRKISSQKQFEPLISKKGKRMIHIKSLPAYDNYESIRKASTSKIESLQIQSPDFKPRRLKTHQHLKAPTFGAVKTARQRKAQWGKKKQPPSQISKSLSKSTNFKSCNHDKDTVRKCSKVQKLQKGKSKKSMKKGFSGILKRVKQVMDQYQIKIEKCIEEKCQVLKQNDRLRNQIQSMQRNTKRSQR